MVHPNTNPAPLSSILRKCAVASALRSGKQAHLHAIVFGLIPHSTLETDLLLMYARCGRLIIARQVFDRMPHRPLHSWNILLSSYAQASLFHHSLALLHPLLASGLRPDHFTLPSLLKASSGLYHGRTGAGLHAFAIEMALNIHLIVSSSIVDMYLKCGKLEDARKMFEEMPERDGVVWNAMVTGFTTAGLLTEAFNLFRKSQFEAVGEDWMALPSVLSACSQSGDLRKGKEVHGRAIRCLVLESDAVFINSLIDMYSKCGFLDASLHLFSRMRVRNLVTWSILISGYGMHGRGKEALRLYEEMIGEGLEPNSVLFTSVLSSCSHSGLIDEGRAAFLSINGVYGLEPSVEHYACMVDLLGRHGRIVEALELIGRMEMEPAGSIWGALLGACVVHQNVLVGEIAARKLFELEPENPSNCVALCSIYERAGNWDGVAEMRRKMRDLVAVKTPGCSWIEVNGVSLCFYQGDVSSPSSKLMLQALRDLLGHYHCRKSNRWYPQSI